MLKIFLNNTRKNTTINKSKKSGAQPSDKPKAALPLCFESVDYLIFPTVQKAEIPMKEILLPVPQKSHTASYSLIFEPLSPHFFDRAER